MKSDKSTSVTITFEVTLDDKKTPTSINWETTGADASGPQPCKSIMISIWDPVKEHTVRFDLWTKKMMRQDMSMFIFQSLLMMADTYFQATGNKKLAGELQDFAEAFGVKAKLIRRDGDDTPTPFKLDV